MNQLYWYEYLQINWKKYLTNLLDDPLSDDEEVIVNVPTFFSKVDKLLTEIDSRLVLVSLFFFLK